MIISLFVRPTVGIEMSTTLSDIDLTTQRDTLNPHEAVV